MLALLVAPLAVGQAAGGPNQSERGKSAERGMPGEPGKSGERGAQGRRGLDGEDGVDGEDGEDGEDGMDGEPGIADVTVRRAFKSLNPGEEGRAVVQCEEGEIAIGGGGRAGTAATAGGDSADRDDTC